MMGLSSVERAARRLNAVAWTCALAATVFVGVRLAQGCRPHDFAVLVLQAPGNDGSSYRFPLQALLSGFGLLLASGLVLRLLLLLGGRAWRHRAEISRSMEVSAPDAERIAECALARLMELGFRVGRKEPYGTDGWTVSATQGRFLTEDPRRMRQTVEFRYSGGRLCLTQHYGRGKWDRLERGEREYQDWLIDSLIRGADLSRPPLRLDPAIITLLLALEAGLCGIGFHLLSEEKRWDWDHALVGAVWPLVLLLPLTLLFSLCSRRWTVGRRLYIPSLLLVLAGVLAGTSGRHTWELESWRSSDDPRTLVRAGISAWRESQPSAECFPSARAKAATEARVEIELRLARMGPSAVPSLLGRLERPPEWMGSLDRWWCQMLARAFTDGLISPEVLYPNFQAEHQGWRRSLLSRLGPEVEPALAEAMGDPDERIRFNVVRVLECQNRSPEVKSALRAALGDPHPGVRHQAVGALFSLLQPRDPETERALIRLIEDPSRDVQKWALVGLSVHRPDESVPALIGFLPRSGPARREVLGALARSINPAALQVLLHSMMGRDGIDQVRSGLISFGALAIGPLLDRLDSGNERHILLILECMRPMDVDLEATALARLLKLADDPSESRSKAALNILAHSVNAQARSRAIRELEGPQAPIVLWPLLDSGAVGRDALLRALDRKTHSALWGILERPWWADDPVVAAGLARHVVGGGSDSWNASRALDLLAERSPGHVEDVARSLSKQGRSSSIRTRALRVLSTPFLLELLDEAKADAAGVATALSGRPEPRVVGALIRSLRKGGPHAPFCAWALARLRAPEALPILHGLVEKGDSKSLSLVLALGDWGSPETRSVLHRLLRRAREGEQQDTYGAAIIALARSGDTSLIPELRSILRLGWQNVDDPLEGRLSLRELAAVALARMGEAGESSLLEALMETGASTSSILPALERSASKAVAPVIRRYLDSWSSLERRAALRALGQRRDPADIPRLVEIALEPADPYSTEVAAWALREITGRDFGARPREDRQYTPSQPLADRIRAAVHAWSTERSD